MKKVFIVHGFEGSPNGGWRPWLMGELEKQGVYACALAMPTPEAPVQSEWLAEIARHVEQNPTDDIYLVGHSLGVPAILRYIESLPEQHPIKGAVLVSGLFRKNENRKIDSFLEQPFDFEKINSRVHSFALIHGDNDTKVPLSEAKELAHILNDAPLTIVKDGGHLNGSSGWLQLPPCLEAVTQILSESR